MENEPNSRTNLVRELRDLRRRCSELEDALARQTEKSEALLSAIPDKVFLHDRQGTYLEYSAPPDAVFTTPHPSTFIGKTVADVLPPGPAQEAAAAIRRVIDSGQAETSEYRVWRADEERYDERRLLPCGEDRALAIIRDVTARRRALQAVRDSAAELAAVFDNTPVLTQPAVDGQAIWPWSIVHPPGGH